MKANKMGAILFTLLMLGGALGGALTFAPVAHAQISRISSIKIVPQPIDFNYPTNGTPGSTFTVGVYGYNVVGLLTFQLGFVYNPKIFKVLSVTNGSWLNTCYDVSGGANISSVPCGLGSGTTKGETGTVTAGYWTFLGDYNGVPWNATGASIDLAWIKFEINSTLTLSAMQAIVGKPQLLVGMSVTTANIQLICTYLDGSTDITPLPANVYNATATYASAVPEFPSTFSSVLVATLLVLTAFTAALFTATTRRRKQKGYIAAKNNST